MVAHFGKATIFQSMDIKLKHPSMIFICSDLGFTLILCMIFICSDHPLRVPSLEGASIRTTYHARMITLMSTHATFEMDECEIDHISNLHVIQQGKFTFSCVSSSVS